MYLESIENDGADSIAACHLLHVISQISENPITQNLPTSKKSIRYSAVMSNGKVERFLRRKFQAVEKENRKARNKKAELNTNVESLKSFTLVF